MDGPQGVADVLVQERREGLRSTGTFAGVLVLVFFPLWGVVDHVLVPDQATAFAAVRLTLMAPLVLAWVALWSTVVPDRRVWVPAAVLFVLPQLAIAWMLPRTGDAMEVYLLGFTITVYGVGLLIVSGRGFAALVMGSSVAAVAVSYAVQRDRLGARELVVTVFYLLTAVGVAGVGRAYRSVLERREVEARVALEQEQARTLGLVEELEERTRQDHLTGVDNRRAWDDALGSAFAQARRAGRNLAVLVIDVDRFKAINDHHGHLVGDEVLVAVARALVVRARATDRVARIGGDEFAVLLPDTDVAGAERLRCDLARYVGSATSLDGPAVSVSVGAAALIPADRTPSDLMSRADADLYAGRPVTRSAAFR